MAGAVGRAVGIDFGTANCVVCGLDGGRPVIVPNAEGARITPAFVAFPGHGEPLVGEPARRQAVVNPSRTFRSIKRRTGQQTEAVVDGVRYSPTDLAALLFGKLRRDAESYFGEAVTDAVVAVPASMLNTQREAIRDAARRAGLNVIRIIYEPTAAALAYGLSRDVGDHKVLIFDLGAGTFDISLLELGDGVFDVVATAGDNALGGDDWDQRIVAHLLETIRTRHRVDLSNDSTALQRLREAAEQAKIELSVVAATGIKLPYLDVGGTRPLHLDTTLTRNQFQQMSNDLLERCREPFERVLNDGRTAITNIERVILVGGATRMPAVADLIVTLTGKRAHQGVNRDEAVAVGAALQAGVLTGEVSSMLLLDVLPLSVGIEVRGGIFFKMVARNTTIPVKRSMLFATAHDDQRSALIPIWQGEREMALYNVSVGLIEVTGLPQAPRGVTKVEVTVDIDADGSIQVSAQALETGNARTFTPRTGARAGDRAATHDLLDPYIDRN